MSDPIVEINAPGIDVEKVIADIRATVADKRDKGLYSDAAVARAERTNLAAFKDDDEFLSFYLECLRESVSVDINDFEIVERRRSMARVLVIFKRTLWKLLKFYTYRLWSQQNQVNGLLLSAIENTENRNRERIQALEERLAKLESRG